jgi:ABC-type bacteriocin/lantibiotic exporter with double-glycine peptidase domain
MIKIIKNIFTITNISKKLIIINILAIASLIILEVASVGIIFPLLGSLTNPNYEFIFIKNIFNIDERKNNILIFIFLVFTIFLLKNIYIFFFNFYQKKFALNKQKYLVNKIFENHTFYDVNKKIEISEILRNINYSNSIGQWIICALQFITEFLLLIFLILFLFFINFNATLLILLICLTFYIIYRLTFKRSIKRWSKENILHAQNNYTSQLETFSGLREITVLDKLNFFKKKFFESLDELIIRGFKISILDILPRIFLELIFVVGFLSLTMYFYYLFKTTEYIIPLLGVYFFTSLRIFPAFSKIIVLTNSLGYANAPINILKNISFYKDKNYKEKFSINNIYKIEFKKVSFKYKNNFILRNCNFIFKKDLFYILIGKSGVGKTTILNLLMGLLNPTKGNVLINKFNLKHCLKSFRKKIGLVSQEVFITNATIMENVALGVEKKNINKSKVIECLTLARLKEFIYSKKERLNFVIEGNGQNISTGQRQRIGIARALYNDPAILLLDEPTSSLDENTSKDFIKSLKKLSKNRIIIMITHNPKNFIYSNKVIYLDKKKLLVK